MLVSFVVIEYNSLEDILVCYNQVKQCVLGLEYEFIVSSNSLYDSKKQEEVCIQYPTFIWSFNCRNGGFAYGMNEGLKQAKGDILVVMNPDVKLISSLVPMVEYIVSHHDVGIIAPKIVDDDGVVQDSFRHYITPIGFIMRHIDRILHKSRLNVKEFDEPVRGEWVIGAFMMCRRDFYEKVGGLSDDYFMYCEDMDWCKRAHLAGYDVIYYPETVIEYKGTRAARRSWKYTKIFIKSLLTYWQKYGVK